MPKKKNKNLKNSEVKKLIIFVFLLFLGFSAGAYFDNNFDLPNISKSANISKENVISTRELEKEIKNKNFTLINVHTPYDGEIMFTDTFIEYDSLVANKDRLPEDKSSQIVLYCNSGSMSEKALQTLIGMGYTNVKHLEGGMKAWGKAGNQIINLSAIDKEVLPEEGIELPVSWGDIGPKMLEAGVIDRDKFVKVMNLTDEQENILFNGSDKNIKIDSANSRFVVNMLWALGLAQKSTVYTDGPMGKEYKDQVGNFASTGGWTLSRGDAVSYLGRYDFISLTDDQQEKVMEIAKNVYRPCCGNHTWFPDCNHGMAALSAIQLMVSAGESDASIYRNILALNSYWFPTTYLQTATMFARKGIPWSDVDAKEILGNKYSSGQGAGEIAKKVGPLPYEVQGVGGSCGA